MGLCRLVFSQGPSMLRGCMVDRSVIISTSVGYGICLHVLPAMDIFLGSWFVSLCSYYWQMWELMLLNPDGCVWGPPLPVLVSFHREVQLNFSFVCILTPSSHAFTQIAGRHIF